MKKKMAQILAEKHKLPRETIIEIINDVFTLIILRTSQGKRVELRDFAVFTPFLLKGSGRISNLPRAKGAKVRDKWKIKIKIGKRWREKLNANEETD
jgi:nucleoid DNA-binding protein